MHNFINLFFDLFRQDKTPFDESQKSKLSTGTRVIHNARRGNLPWLRRFFIAFSLLFVMLVIAFSLLFAMLVIASRRQAAWQSPFQSFLNSALCILHYAFLRLLHSVRNDMVDCHSRRGDPMWSPVRNSAFCILHKKAPPQTTLRRGKLPFQ